LDFAGCSSALVQFVAVTDTEQSEIFNGFWQMMINYMNFTEGVQRLIGKKIQNQNNLRTFFTFHEDWHNSFQLHDHGRQSTA
jgi:hypothetical protein